MKKKLLILLGFFIAFIFNISIVSAEEGDNIVCTYGLKDGNNWTPQWKIMVDGAYNKTYIDGSASAYLQPGGGFEEGVTNFTEVTGEAYNYVGEVDRSGSNYDVYVYASIYPNETVYKNLKGGCPTVLKQYLAFETGLFGGKSYHIVIYNDELDQKEPDYEFWRDLKEDLVSETYLVEEGSKEKNIEDLIDDYECVTYSSSIEMMKKSIEDSPSDSCDDNVEFTRLYQELSANCESYRSTSFYAKDDGTKMIAKACNRACSVLNDDIAAMCNADSKSFGSCGSLGDESTQWLFRIVKIVRYSVPALLIILSILDFIKALASESEDEMKKATGRFTKRLIAAVLLFVIPFILDFILAIFDIPGLDPTNPFCAK